jgi:hypothetical protein
MIVSDFLACPLAIHSTDFGIIEDVDVVRTDAASDIVSRHFHIQIRDFADLEKIRMPVVTHNRRRPSTVTRPCARSTAASAGPEGRPDAHLVHALGLT